MTTSNTAAKLPPDRGRFPFPDPPEHRPEDRLDKMTNFNKMSRTGNVHYLALHLGRPETTLVAGEHYVSPQFTRDMDGLRYPDLLVAFDVDPEAYYLSNAYVLSEQGKPPDFVLEVASASTWREDAGPKRESYAALGVGEYWRFDETGRYGGRLHGERLVEGEYVALPIEELAEGSWQGYSAALDLYLRWEPSELPPLRVGPARGLERGELVFYDPATGSRILTYEDQRARADAEREARITERARADTAEARVRELEEQLRRQEK